MKLRVPHDEATAKLDQQVQEANTLLYRLEVNFARWFATPRGSGHIVDQELDEIDHEVIKWRDFTAELMRSLLNSALEADRFLQETEGSNNQYMDIQKMKDGIRRGITVIESLGKRVPLLKVEPLSKVEDRSENENLKVQVERTNNVRADISTLELVKLLLGRKYVIVLCGGIVISTFVAGILVGHWDRLKSVQRVNLWGVELEFGSKKDSTETTKNDAENSR